MTSVFIQSSDWCRLSVSLGCGIAEILLSNFMYIYLPHKNGRLAEPSIHKMRTTRIFSNWCGLFFFSFFSHYYQALFVLLFMIGPLLIAWPIIAVVLGKATIFHLGLNGHRADNVKQTLLDFSFSLLKKQKNKKSGNSCSRRVREWKRSGISEGLWYGGRGFFIGCFSVGSSSLKKI